MEKIRGIERIDRYEDRRIEGNNCAFIENGREIKEYRFHNFL